MCIRDSLSSLLSLLSSLFALLSSLFGAEQESMPCKPYLLFMLRDVRAHLSCALSSYQIEPTARDIPPELHRNRCLETLQSVVHFARRLKSFPKRGCLVGYGRNPKMILSQCCIDFDTKTFRFGHISGPSYRGAHAGWRAGWLVRRLPAARLGHTNA